MNRHLVVLGTVALALVVFFVGRSMVDQPTPPSIVNVEPVKTNEAATATSETLIAKKEAPAGNALIRPYSPILGPENAPVTIVEFFDPACEACRAMHPTITEIRKQHPEKVRIIMRYAAFHDGSDIAVRILETARLQGVFEPVLIALLETQPQWANHSGAKLDIAWEAAKIAGLDIEKARQQMNSAEIDNVLTQDAADIETINVRQTPTFFVDGLPLLEFGAEQLMEMVRNRVESTN
jgi:protein-disulfide isomerase